jgi:hypothetical protein
MIIVRENSEVVISYPASIHPKFESKNHHFEAALAIQGLGISQAWQ